MKRLLAIDDSLEIGALILAIAKPLGYAGRHAPTFTKFKSMLADDPAVIVVDMMMPDTDGIEVLRYLAEQQCRAGIVLLSHVDQRVLSVAADMARASQLRLIGHLRKPFARSDLEALLKREVSADVPDFLRKPDAPSITEDALRRAVAEDQFIAHYQPQVDIKTGAAVGVEALARWQHPVHGLLYPDSFIGPSESWNLVNEVTWRVVDKVFADARMFAAHGWAPALSINLSAFALSDLTLPDTLLAHAEGEGLLPSRITVEITESGLVTQIAEVLDILVRLRIFGFNLSIDDFGTGFSMVQQLKRIPATEVKLDKAFVRAMDRDRDALVIVRKTIEIGHEMGLAVVADGVETQAHLRVLGELQCDRAQGHLFAPPMPAAEVVAWRKKYDG